MDSHDYIENLYECVDDKNVDRLSGFLADGVCFQFANAAPVTGKAAVLAANEVFFSNITSLFHSIHNVWAQGDYLICNGDVHYIRLDGSDFSATFATILKLKDQQITDYRIYADISAL